MKDTFIGYYISSIFFVFVCTELIETSEKLSVDTEHLLDSAGFPRSGDIPILNGKVFKGQRVSIREHPYIASIRRNYVHFLTGTILTRNLILTVAHPLIDGLYSTTISSSSFLSLAQASRHSDSSLLTVVADSSVPIYELGVVVGQNYADRGTILNTVILVIVHQNFDRYTLQNDIAILRLFENLVYKGSVKSITILAPGSKLNGATAFVSGWGRCDNMGSELCLPRSSKYKRDEIIDPMLRSVSFTLNFPNYYCDGYTRNNIQLKPGMLCIGPAREESPVCPCLAVPGAPLVVNARLVALSSWGFGCGYVFDLPLVYTDIAANVAWILKNSIIQHDIKSNNISLLYQATKAYVLLKWINETRVMVPKFSLKANKLMLPLDIDKKLSATLDVIYDIRDYIYGGAYHASKMIIYDEYRKRDAKLEQIKLLKPKIHTKPFLNKEVLKDIELK